MSHTETETHQETQANKRGSLYAKVLQDYRRAREQSNHHRERAQRLQDQATLLTATFDPLRTPLQETPSHSPLY